MRSTVPRGDPPTLTRFCSGWARMSSIRFVRKGRPFREASATIISGVALAEEEEEEEEEEEKEAAKKQRSRRAIAIQCVPAPHL